VRWSILACLTGFSFFGYVQRTGITIAAEPMMRDLRFGQVLLGWLLTAFLVRYSIFQIPVALLGERFGARRTLTSIGVAAILATFVIVLTPRLPVFGAVATILIAAQLLLGVAQAGLFPVASGAIRNWFPTRNWGFAQGCLVTGIWIGSAVTPPLVSALMVWIGWRGALAVTCVPALLLLGWWQHYARDRPSQHGSVGAEELAEIGPDAPAFTEPVKLARIARLLADQQVLLLTVSYFLMNYVFYLVTFWPFIYLRQERHLTMLESGWLASLPFLTAALASVAGGRLTDRLIARYGLRWGMRVLPLLALPSAGLLLWLTGAATNAYVAVAALCLAFGCCEIMEGNYWSAAMRAAPEDSMAATAVLNTGGNLGGVVATPVIAALSASQQWTVVFGLGAIALLAAAALWFWVDVAPGVAATNEVLA